VSTLTNETAAPAETGKREFALAAGTGMLGSGFRRESVEKAAHLGARFLGCDAGSTDPGPRSLATGDPQFGREAVKRDTGVILDVAREHGIPMIIGSAGTSGANSQVDWMAEIVRELAAERGLNFKLALIRSEQSQERLLELHREGRIKPLEAMEPLTEEQIGEVTTAVAMMGVEPIQQAYKEGADVIIAGRCSDPAIYAALPLLEGYPAGVAWHAAKTIECGAAPVIKRMAPDSMMAVLRDDSFEVFPLRDDYRVTPQSIASHSLYENANPFEIREPGGTLVTNNAEYTAQTDARVKVAGSEFRPAETYTMKLEGVRLSGYSTVVAGAIRDPYIIESLDEWLAEVDDAIATRLADISEIQGDYSINLRVYGRDGVLGAMEPPIETPAHEVMVFWEVVAENQELAHTIAKSVCHLALHHPIPKWHGLITGLALPFSPPEIDRGPVYEFFLNHVVELDSPLDLSTIELEDV
jgi:hypothetical protein